MPALRPLRLLVTALVATLLALTTVTPAVAYAPVGIVHTEQVQAGPYAVTVGFSTWPMRAMRSLDITFMPSGGTAGKSGIVGVGVPGMRGGQQLVSRLARHPRKRDTWGLDTKAFDKSGSYSFRFVIDGPQGRGEGVLRDLTVLDQPGPPLPLSWTLACLPLLGLVALVAVAWRRTRPGRPDRLAALLHG
ncbi:hypothetical protein AB0J86_15000 [Micromonospora sp. NPDC049559]|uniref:hypothetical protein n=1 Tax=Micromonospora sp. NPDC049559 TaxID=3155923 RepID=UPI00343699F4